MKINSERLIMNKKEILRAVQAGEISPEQAAKELREMMEDAITKQSEQHSSENTMQQAAVNLYEIAPGIVQLTMQDRVNKNTFSYELVSGLMQSFELIRTNPNYKVLILTGYDSYFASGGTKEGLLSIYEGKNKFTDTNIYSLALDCKIPVIAAMQGHGIGAGWSMGMFCDLIVMSQESIYTSNYIKYGFTPGAGATLIFPEKLGISLSQEILYTGKKYHGSELKSMGIPFPVLPRKDVLPYAIQLAKTLAESPREALIALKDLMAESIRAKVSLTYEKELKMHDKTFVNQPGVKERIQLLYGESSENDNKKKSLGVTMHSEKEVAVTGNINVPLQNQALENSIAIIGIAGQFPKSKTLAQFWDNVAQGTDCISEIPQTRWSIDDYYDPDPGAPGKTYCKYMGDLEDVAKFDPLFFGISPAEAEFMDPQQRLFLENCWSCIEDAGITPASLSGSRCGVFVGCTPSDYGQLLQEQGKGFNAQGFTGGASSILPARISYLLNLKGPCLAIDTACSSSLVAITEACNSLVLQTSDLALAGGVSVMAGPSMHIQTSKSGMLSPDGRCFSFDARANGIVPGEGVGVVLLKRLSEAVRDGDPIYGVMRGWGVNQNGKTNGITAPSVNSQILLEKEVYQRFRIDPTTISLVEAHGTGTKLGDSMEVEALAESFQSFTQKKNYCALGSVKSNIGHLLAASGVSGVIKIVLALQHRMLPPTINFEKINEYICLDNTPFYINTKLQPWEVAEGTPRRACVNSFGFSGTNAHIVIEEYHANTTGTPIPINANNPIILVLSAKSEEQLKVYAKSMQSYVESHADLNLADMAYTLQVGREAMDHRLAFVADSRETLVQVFEGFINDTSSSEVLSAQVTKSKNGKTQVDEGMLETWIQEKKLKEVAELWVKGLNLDWDKFYVGAKPGRISLPTYPFAREHYWVLESKPEFASITATSLETTLQSSVSVESLQEELATSLAEALFRQRSDIGIDIRFIDMGMDSIVGVNWIQKINNHYGTSIAVTKGYDYPTISEFARFMEKELSKKNRGLTQTPLTSTSPRWQFSELIHLNQSTQGRPVFWFHGGLGGIEIYQEIAQKFQRPFYGIQARGWMTDRSPLHGIEAMVAYYIHMIQSVQPEGPYDLGGYSLGGTLAYETTRQLQELGQAVDSIVMLDSIDSARMKIMTTSQKNVILQAVNIALAFTVMQEPEKITQALIHRDELDSDLEDEVFFEQIINLAKTRGLSKSEAQLYSQIQQSVKVQQAYKLEDYSVWPLPDPKAVSCYYFRNKSGLFLGELEPYFLSGTDEILVDKVNYWEEWERQLPNFKMIDVDSSNHMMLLSEPKSLEAIVAICEKLYS